MAGRRALEQYEAGRRRMARRMVCSALLMGAVPGIAGHSAFAADTAGAEGLPAPPVSLKVTPSANGGPWRLSIENSGEGPVRVPADARLLILDLTPPTTAPDPAVKKKAATATTTVRCVLPDDTRPATDEGANLVIPSKRSWSTSFDPLFHCFGARELAALVAGTSVRATFGWPPPVPRPRAPKTTEPFAVTPVGASVGKIAPAKAIAADVFVLPDAVMPKPPSNDDGSSGAVTLVVPDTLDAARGFELSTTVTLSNGSDRPITLLYRPEMILFTVTGPTGTVPCGTPRLTVPIRELMSTVPPKGRLDTSVLFTATCPPGTFDVPGIYRVLPRLDTTATPARSLGIKTWEGVATAKSPLLVRVRASRGIVPPARPALD